MRPLALRRFAPVLAAAAFAVSCSDSSTAPSSQQPADLTTLLGEMTLPSVSAAADAAMPAAGTMLGARPAIVPDACAYSRATESFVCPTVTVNGLTLTRSFKLFDAAGHTQSKFDANTAAIETISSMKGTLTVAGTGAPAYSIDRAEDMTLSGIKTNTRTLNGTATMKLDGTITTSNGTVQMHVDQTETTSNLELPNPRTGSRWPKGTITMNSTTTFTPNGEQTVTSQVESKIVFDGQGKATITISTGFGTVTCTIDLSNPGARQGCLA